VRPKLERRARVTAGITSIVLALLALGTCYARFQCARAEREEHTRAAEAALARALSCRPEPCPEALALAREETLSAMRSSAWPEGYPAFLLQSIDFLSNGEGFDADSPGARILGELQTQGTRACQPAVERELAEARDELAKARLALYSRLCSQLEAAADESAE
jgi:hypothetical protein